MNTPNGYTISAASRVIGVARLTIYRWIESGRVLPVKTPTRYIIPAEQVANIRLGIQ